MVGNKLSYYTCQFALGCSKGLLFNFSWCLITWFCLAEALKRWNFLFLKKGMIKVSLPSSLDFPPPLIGAVAGFFPCLVKSFIQKLKCIFLSCHLLPPPLPIIWSSGEKEQQLQVWLICKASDLVFLHYGRMIFFCKIFCQGDPGVGGWALFFFHNQNVLEFFLVSVKERLPSVLANWTNSS